MKRNHLLSCDWGTSSFRLYLLNCRDGKRLAEVTSNEGIARVFDKWDQQGAIDRPEVYREVLKKHLHTLSASLSFSLENIPLIISGMASSSIGIKELPYAGLPFPLEGQQTVTWKLAASADFPHDMILVSGIKSDNDVMRGEETQLMGLAPMFPEDAVFLFPGTHSKHIHVKGGLITGFETYMTGELFQLLSRHSILTDSIEKPPSAYQVSPDCLEAFRSGVSHPEASNLLRSAFLVRTNHLFGKLDKLRNFHFLSGLLIGAELRNLKSGKAGSIVLCGGETFSVYYQQAAEELRLPGTFYSVSPDLADQAASRGHLRLYHLLQRAPSPDNIDENSDNRYYQ